MAFSIIDEVYVTLMNLRYVTRKNGALGQHFENFTTISQRRCTVPWLGLCHCVGLRAIVDANVEGEAPANKS